MTYEGEEEEDDGKLPSVDHGRRTDRGRDKKSLLQEIRKPKQNIM
jgi:hypothetical protein